jgi:predicted dehydrogenase/nucleoside-diphosphate-sugar epimerase
MTLRAGIVGAGNISVFHIRALQRLQDVEIVGVCDLDSTRAQALAAQTGIAVHPSLAALRDAGANVIHVLTPPAAHAQVAIDALALGCDVFVEKPLATSGDDCERIAEAAERHGRQVCVGHSLLFDPLVRRTLEIVKSGAIGKVLTFDYFRCQRRPPSPPNGAGIEQRQGGYPFRDLGIHALYLAEAFVGAIEHVDAWPGASGRSDCNLMFDEWRVLARCAGGTAQIQLSWNVRPQQNMIVVQGTHGTVRCDLFGPSVTVRRQRPLPEPATRLVNTIGEGLSGARQAFGNAVRFATGRLWQFHGVQALIAEFYDCLRTNRPSPVPARAARNVVFWTEAVAREADRRRDQMLERLTAKRSGAKTLVTGATGFIGRNLVRRLLRQEHPIRMFVRRPPAPEIADHPLVEVMIGDLGDPTLVDRAVQGTEIVYHIGAAMGGGREEYQCATVNGTHNIVESCLRHDVRRLVYMSSLSVIDTDAGRDGKPIDEVSAIERDPGSRGAYTQAKVDAERIVRDAVRERGLRAVLLRPGEVVGAEKPLLTAGVAQRIGSTLVMFGSGGMKLPLIHVADLIDATLAATDPSVSNGSVIQLVDDCAVTKAEIVESYKTRGENYRVIHVPIAALLVAASMIEAIFRRMGRNAPIGRRRILAATTPRTFDCTVAARVLGWRPRVGVRAAFATADESTDLSLPAPTSRSTLIDQAVVAVEV